MARGWTLAVCGVLTLLGTGCVIVADGAAAIEDSIVFQPRQYPEGDWATDPGVEDIWFQSSGGLHLHG